MPDETKLGETATPETTPVTSVPSPPVAVAVADPSADDQALVELLRDAVELDELAGNAAESLVKVTASAQGEIDQAQHEVNVVNDQAAAKWRELTDALTTRGRKSTVPAIVNMFTAVLIACITLAISPGCDSAHRNPQASASAAVLCQLNNVTREIRGLRQDLNEGLVSQEMCKSATRRPTLVSILDELAGMRSDLKRTAITAAFTRPRRDPLISEIAQRVERIEAREATPTAAPPVTVTGGSPVAKPETTAARKLKLRPCRPGRRCTSCTPLLVCHLACVDLVCDAATDRPLRYWTPVRNLIENLRPVRRALKLFRDPQRAAVFAPSVA